MVYQPRPIVGQSYDYKISPEASSDERMLRGFQEKAPPFCECARIGKRELSWAQWIPWISDAPKGSLLDRHNIEFSHQHIFFEGSEENVGWGDHGIFSEVSSTYPYKMETECYDGAIIREALAITKTTPTNFNPSIAAKVSSLFKVNSLYGFLRNNCQDFVARVMQNYQFLFDKRLN